jgi:hypothetical protein
MNTPTTPKKPLKKSDKKTVERSPLLFSYDERPIVDALKLINDGEHLCEASADLKALNALLSRQGGKGFINIKISLDATKGRQIVCKAKVTRKLPEAEAMPTLLYADDFGNLVTFDPTQMTFLDELTREAEEAGE